MSILIVDDSADERALLQSLLHGAGYSDVVHAESASEALDCLASNEMRGSSPIELVLLDLLMPNPNGIEICRRIKSIPTLHDIPVIMVTVKNDKEGRLLAMAAGANDYLIKPVDKIDLSFRVRMALQLKRERDQLKMHQEQLERLKESFKEAKGKEKSWEAMAKEMGICTRREFEECLRNEWQRTKASNTSFSIILANLDRFQDFNERYGSHTGDEYLRRVGKVLTDTLRTKTIDRRSDLVAHDYGDQFLVLLPEEPLEKVGPVIQRIQTALSTHLLPIEPGSPALTASFGYASYPHHGPNPRQVLLHAHSALCWAKEQGGNCAYTAQVYSDGNAESGGT